MPTKTDVTGLYNSTVNGQQSMLGRLDTATEKLRNKRSSIVAAAKKNIFEFPVFMSNSIPLDFATATSSLLEQVYASYLQMAISLNPVIDHSQAIGGMPFSGLKSDTEKYLEYTDTWYQHDACHASYELDEAVLEFDMIDVDTPTVAMIMEYANHEPLSEFNHYFTEYAESERWDRQAREDAKTQESRTKTAHDEYERQTKAFAAATEDLNKTKKAHGDKIKELNKVTKEFEKATKRADAAEEKFKSLQEKYKEANKTEKEQLKKELELTRKEREEAKKDEAKKKVDLRKAELEVEKLEKDAADRSKYSELDNLKRSKDARISTPKFISEKDIEKMNTMRPILMSAELNVKSDNGVLSPVSYIVGVKTHTRLIDAETIPDVAAYPLKEMNKIARKAKWRAGELKFFSDIVFHIKQKKQTAVDSRDPKRKWYRRLYELAHMQGDAPTAAITRGHTVIGSFIFDKIGKPKAVNGLIPNVTLVISKTDVDMCKMKTGIDLMNKSQATKLCNELFLLGFVVIDNDNERIAVLLPDLNNDFDIHSIASINRQMASLDSNALKNKEYNRLINR
jgi:hypothetical protein